MKKFVVAIAAALSLGLMAGCSTDADTVSYNLSQDAEYFKIQRRVVFFNGITDKYLLEIEGRCSVETGDSMLDNALEVTCKVGPGQYKKHFLGLSDNVSFLVEQLESADVSQYHYKIVFKPEQIVPDIDLRTSRTTADD